MTRGRIIGIALALVLAPLGFASAEDFYYYEANGEIVITNTPNSDSRPMPARAPAAPTLEPAPPPSWSKLPPTPYDPHIVAVARENGLSPNLVKAVARVESGFNPRAVSPKGARGLMQLMPATMKQHRVSDPFHALQNLRGGARHLRYLMSELDGDLVLTLAAYNAGLGTVRRHGGVPAYRETLDFVRRVQLNMGREPGEIRSAPRLPPARPVRVVRRDDGTVLLSNE